jgi:hypothetical protein
VWLHEYEANEAPDAVDVYLDWREADLRGRYKTAMNDIEFGDRMALLEAPGIERIMRTASPSTTPTPTPRSPSRGASRGTTKRVVPPSDPWHA